MWDKYATVYLRIRLLDVRQYNSFHNDVVRHTVCPLNKYDIRVITASKGITFSSTFIMQKKLFNRFSQNLAERSVVKVVL